jgi:hypothetical protein
MNKAFADLSNYKSFFGLRSISQIIQNFQFVNMSEKSEKGEYFKNTFLRS